MRPACALLLVAAACTGPKPGAPSGPAAETPAGDRVRGAALYRELCASCHGPAGEGGTGTVLRGRTGDAAALAQVIDATMPKGMPERCDAVCARDVAAYVLGGFAAEPACVDIAPGPRQLRLLTRAEYDATVRDLLGPCTLRGFQLRGHYSSVELMGDFNGWGAQPKPLRYQAESDRWFVEVELTPGEHLYKLKADGQWLADPDNPRTAPDGFGGNNSVVTVSCSAAAPSAAFPAEVRPRGFAFDDHASAGTVTAVHVEEHLKAATALAASADLVRLVPCAPSADCAERFVKELGLRAFRRPLTAEEVARKKALVLAAPTFAEGARAAIASLLLSPGFLYRPELALDAYETAAALSYFYWGSMPDAALLEAARAGTLDVAAQSKRLLADPRARPVLRRFALQWLGVERVLTADKRETFTAAERQALADETARFVEAVVLDESHRFEELFTAGWTMSGGAKQPVAAERAAGLLAHGSVLASTAHSDQTSPVLRGLFVRQRLLCHELGTPPANAGVVPAVDPSATTRERFAQHSAGSCAACHRYLDPIGFGFERFDELGRARATDNGRPIDSRGELADAEGLGSGTSVAFTTLPELGALLGRSRAAKRCLARHVFRFAMGRLERAEDECAVRALAARLEETGDLRELWLTVPTLQTFTERQ